MIVKIIRDGFYGHVEHLCSGCAGGGPLRRLISQVQAETEDRLESMSTFVYYAVGASLSAALGQE